MATFQIDEDTAHKGFLYVDVDRIATIIIRRWEGQVHVEVCPYGQADFTAVAELDMTDRALIAARARNKRKNRK